jgi:hypothetical protein
VGTSAAVSVTVANSVPDTTAPTVSVSAPAAGATVGRLVNVAATASDAVGVTSVQFYLDGNVLGAPMTATPYQLAWDTTSVPNGSHVLTARASDAAGNVGTSAPVTVTVANAPPSGLATDLTVSKDGTGNQTTAAFTTAGSGDLLLAFVSADGPAVASGQQATVSGAGLTWTRIKRANLRYGTSEVWQARATGVLTNATVTSALASSGYQSLTVVALRGAVGVGASIGASSVTGAPSVSVTTTAASSWLFAVGNDWDGAVARTLPAGQTMVHQVLPSVGDTLWVQTAHPNLGAGVASSIGATAPTNHQWNLVAVEVKPAP